jgi:hypothetical protein
MLGVVRLVGPQAYELAFCWIEPHLELCSPVIADIQHVLQVLNRFSQEADVVREDLRSNERSRFVCELHALANPQSINEWVDEDDE